MLSEEAIYAMMAEEKRKNRKENGDAGEKKASPATKDKKRMSEEEKQDMIRMGLIKKKECESAAVRVVERLCDPKVDREWLRESVRTN